MKNESYWLLHKDVTGSCSQARYREYFFKRTLIANTIAIFLYRVLDRRIKICYKQFFIFSISFIWYTDSSLSRLLLYWHDIHRRCMIASVKKPVKDGNRDSVLRGNYSWVCQKLSMQKIHFQRYIFVFSISTRPDSKAVLLFSVK